MKSSVNALAEGPPHDISALQALSGCLQLLSVACQPEFVPGAGAYELAAGAALRARRPRECAAAAVGKVGAWVAAFAHDECRHPYRFSAREVLLFLSQAERAEVDTLRAFESNGIRGPDLAQLTADDLRYMGLPVGYANSFMAERKAFLSPPLPVYVPPEVLEVELSAAAAAAAAASNVGDDTGSGDTASPSAPPPPVEFDDLLKGVLGDALPVEVEASVTFESVYSIDELGFSFSAQVRAMVTWPDTLLWSMCDAVDASKMDAKECAYTWRPRLNWANARDVEVLESQLYTFVPGKPLAMYIEVVRGEFMMSLAHQKFPKDVQKLAVSLYINCVHCRRHRIRFGAVVGAVTDQAALVGDTGPERMRSGPKADYLSGWELATAKEDIEAWEQPLVQSKPGDITAEGGMLREMVDQAVALGNYDAGADTTLSLAVVRVKVARKTQFYVLNYVLVVILLTGLSWIGLLLDPSLLEERAGMSLTLVLALNVFQLLLNSDIPKAGYLTPMHSFVIGSTFFVALVAIESVAVAVLRRRVAVRVRLMAALGGSKHKLKTLGQGSVLPSVDSERSGAAIPDDAEAAPPARPRTLAALTAGANNATGCCAGAATRGSVAWRFEAFLAEHLDAISLVLLPGTYSVFLAFSGVL